ncbi:phosphatidylglycerol lysyltransferase domain-containing protein [Clostridioides difficile]
MENFRNLTIRDKDLFDKYLTNIANKSYEYSFATLYLWRDLCNTKYSIIDNCLIIKKETTNGTIFMMPIGYNKFNLKDLVLKLKTLTNDNSIYLLGDIEDDFINDLKKYSNLPFKIFEDRDNFEYIYLTNDLINLTGKKYHQKKNHYNSFINSYNYKITSIDSDKKINDCINLLHKWHSNKTNLCKELQIEIKEINDLLYNLDYLNLYSIAIYVDDILVGFSVGEILRDTAIIHIERCDINYKGIYSFINNEFIKKDFSNTIYINRQEDCGCSGLRKAKLSYKPLYLLKKSLIII